MLRYGDKVKIKNRGYSGTVVEEAAWSGHDGKAYHWVEYYPTPRQRELSVFCSEDLVKVFCTCGADSAYAPRKAPGHAHYCDKI